MPARDLWNDDQYEAPDGDDDSGWDEPDYDSPDDDEPTMPCPYCREEIHEDAQRCPRCGEYISAEDAKPAAKPWWILVGVAAVFYITYRWIAG